MALLSRAEELRKEAKEAREAVEGFVRSNDATSVSRNAAWLTDLRESAERLDRQAAELDGRMAVNSAAASPSVPAVLKTQRERDLDEAREQRQAARVLQGNTRSRASLRMAREMFDRADALDRLARG